MILKIGITAGAGLIGFAADRLSHRIQNSQTNLSMKENLVPKSGPQSGTGDERLKQLSETLRKGTDGNPVPYAVDNQVQKMSKLGGDFNVMSEKKPGIKFTDVNKMWEQVKKDTQTSVGFAKVFTGRTPLTYEDKMRMSKATAKDIWEKVTLSNIISTTRKAADASYVAATTSDEGVKTAIDATTAKVEFEAKATAISMVGVQSVAFAIGLMPIPGALIAANMFRAAGTAAGTNHMSAVMREIGGNKAQGDDSAVREELGKILREKAGKFE